MGSGVLKVGVLPHHWKDCEDGLEDRLEEHSGNTSLDVLSKLSQHEELHDLKPHCSKMV